MLVSETLPSSPKAPSTLLQAPDVTRQSSWPDSSGCSPFNPRTFAECCHFPNSAESPGVLFVSQAFAAFDEQTYSAAFGGVGVTMIDSMFEFYRPRVTQEQEADK